MRFIPILTAILVAGFLYLLVLERDKILSFASGGSNDTDQASAEQTEQQPTVSVIAVNSLAQSINSAVILRGQTEAARQVVVMAETSGLVISDPLRKGAQISAGQLLCELEPGIRHATLNEALARYAEAEINAKAAEQLAGGGFASETRVIAARAGLQAAQARVDAANKELERLKIHAPFGGLLESDTAEIGSLMQPGAPCATVIQLDPIKLVGFVPETEVNRASLGAIARARLATGQEVVGQVTFLSKSADPQTRTFRLEIEVANSDNAIRDGQTVEIGVAAEGSSAHLLPSSSMTLDDTGRLGVRIVEDDNRAGFRPVTLLRDTVDGVWLSGLPDEVAVIVSGQEYVIDGVKMAVVYQDGIDQ